MKVVLLKEVKSLGKEGAVVEVSEGYARNFLFPQHLAVEGSDAQIRKVKEKKDAAVRKEKKSALAEKELARDLDGREVVILAKANEDGSLYAAVGAKDISKALADEDQLTVKADWITFEPQKEVGQFEAQVQFPSGYDAQLTVIIESQE